MFSANQARLKAALAVLAAVGAVAAADVAQAQAVVVRSTGPSATQYPQGRRLPANAKVTLRSGDRMTVLDKAGTRVLSGPGNFTLDGSVARDQGTSERVSNIITGSSNPRVRTGAVRGVPPPMAATASKGPDSIWYIDVTKGGSYCVANPAQLVLWRPNRDQDAAGKLTAVAGGKTAAVMWKRGSAVKLWPVADLPLTDGATYTFSDPVGPTVRITTRLIGAVPSDDLEVAGLLGDRGCTAQLDVLANAASPPVGG